MFNPYGMEQPSFGSSPIVAGDNPINLPIPKVKRGGMFGGVKIDPAAGIAGFLAGLGNPAGMQTLQAIHQQRMYEQEQAAQEQEYQQHRQDSYTDALNLYDYKREHPEAPNNDTVNDYSFILQQLGPDAAKQYLRTKADPPQFMQVPGVGIVQIPRSGGGFTTPTAPVGKLTPIDGGPTPPASGGFL